MEWNDVSAVAGAIAATAEPLQLSPTKVVCIGRNYADHAKELGNAVPQTPILFIKPTTSIRSVNQGVQLPAAGGACHYETELCVKVGSRLENASVEQAQKAIVGLTLGLDLTLRDLQNELKKQGQPWERAKAFDGACVLGDWLPSAFIEDWQDVRFSLTLNDKIVQKGHTEQMLFGVVELVAHISEVFTLLPGDVIMTGTPAGVGPLQVGDRLRLGLDGLLGPVYWETWVE